MKMRIFGTILVAVILGVLYFVTGGDTDGQSVHTPVMVTPDSDFKDFKIQ